MAPYLSSALGAFHLLLKDYQSLLEYVHPCEENKQTFSHRTYELLLRSCTEFESLAKHGAVELNLIAAGDYPHIGELSALFDALELRGTEVGILPWEPSTWFVAPLVSWTARPHGLAWYRAYNEVKHNRSRSFSKATLENVSLSLAACLQLLQRLGALPLRAALYRVDHELYVTEWHFRDVPLTLRTPNNWAPFLKGESAV